MLASKKRLSKSLFKDVMDKGKSFHSPLFTARLIKVKGENRFSVTVSKKVSKSAVVRNKLRRRTYSAIRSLYPQLEKGLHGVFIGKTALLKASFIEIEGSIKEIFVNSGFLK